MAKLRFCVTTLNQITPLNERILSFSVKWHANLTLNKIIFSLKVVTVLRGLQVTNDLTENIFICLHAMFYRVRSDVNRLKY